MVIRYRHLATVFALLFIFFMATAVNMDIQMKEDNKGYQNVFNEMTRAAAHEGELERENKMLKDSIQRYHLHK